MNVVLTLANSREWVSLADKIDGFRISSIKNIPLSMNVGVKKQPNSTDVFILQKACEPQELVELLEREQVELIILFYRQAEYGLATVIDKQGDIESSLNEWQKNANFILDIQKINRKRLRLVNIDQALVYPSELFCQLKEFGILGFGAPVQYEVDDFSLLLACQCVSQKVNILEFNNLLQISSMCLQADNKISLDVEKIINEFDENRKKLILALSQLDKAINENAELGKSNIESSELIENLRSKLKLVGKAYDEKIGIIKADFAIEKKQLDSELKSQFEKNHEEKEFLISQLHKTQESFESVFLDKEKLEVRLKSDNESYRKLLESLTLEVQKERLCSEERLEENILLTSLLHKAQEKFESVFFEKKKYEKEVMKLEKKLKKSLADLESKNYRLGLLSREMNEIKESVSWKTGTPIRMFRSLFNKSASERESIEREVELILSSEFFDTEWYLSQYPDVADSNMIPAEHYLLYGSKEERSPGPSFSNKWYKDAYPDVAESGMNPLLHYIKYGKAEGRTASIKLLQDLSKVNVSL